MKPMALTITVVVALLLHGPLVAHPPAALAHDRAARHRPSDSIVLPALQAARARQLLASIAPLSMVPQATKDVNVKSSVLCYCLSKGGESIQVLRRLQAEWFVKGKTSFAGQDYSAAITAFSRVINMNVRDARLYTNRGLSYANHGDYRLALQDFSQAIELNHHQAEAYYARGLTAFIIDDMPAARLDLQTAARLNYAPARRLLRPTQEPSTR